MMKTLSALLVGCLMCSSAFAKEWDFDVYLDKTKIGQHTFSLNEANKLVSQAKFNVKVLFINAYQYQHTAIEEWQDGCLKSLEASTLENEVATKVKGSADNDRFVVNDGKEQKALPACAMTFAYWSQKMLQQTKLLNPQNAEWLDTRIIKTGSEMLDVKGQKIEALRYKLNASLAGKPKLNIDLWYRADNHDWVALRSTTPEGYIINYKLR